MSFLLWKRYYFERDRIIKFFNQVFNAFMLFTYVRADKYCLFSTPVLDQHAPNYSKLIKFPMSFDKIRSKIILYNSAQEFYVLFITSILSSYFLEWY